MPEKEMKQIMIEMNYLGVSQQRELDAYRKLGTVAHLKRLRRQEIRRIKRLRATIRILRKLVLGVCVAFELFELWVFISWIDIIAHNMKPDPVYQIWNFFTLFF